MGVGIKMPLRPTEGINVSLHAISSFTAAAETEDVKKGGGIPPQSGAVKMIGGGIHPAQNFSNKKI